MLFVTCAPIFLVSGTAGQIALKFGVWLRDHWLCILQRMEDNRTSMSVTIHTFKHIYWLALVHRANGVLLVNIVGLITRRGFKSLFQSLSLGEDDKLAEMSLKGMSLNPRRH